MRGSVISQYQTRFNDLDRHSFKEWIKVSTAYSTSSVFDLHGSSLARCRSQSGHLWTSAPINGCINLLRNLQYVINMLSKMHNCLSLEVEIHANLKTG